MELLILTPNGIAFEGECDEVYLPTTRGPMGIMEDYTPVAMDKYRNHGKMSRSHRQERPGVIINPEPKARREYYTNKGFSGGKRGKFWLERMKLDRRGEILNAAKEAVK